MRIQLDYFFFFFFHWINLCCCCCFFYGNYWFLFVHCSTDDIHAIVLDNLIQGTLAMTNSQMKSSRAFQVWPSLIFCVRSVYSQSRMLTFAGKNKATEKKQKKEIQRRDLIINLTCFPLSCPLPNTISLLCLLS